MAEKLAIVGITPMEQTFKAGCVPTSISMVFSGFGIDISEQTLIDTYFPGGKLPLDDPKRGVSNTDTLLGMVQIVNDLGLRDSLQVDAFFPGLHRFTSFPEDKYIVAARPQDVRKYGHLYKDDDMRNFFLTTERLLTEGKIGVFTANDRMLKQIKANSYWTERNMAYQRFYGELDDFISKGHIVGPHGGMTLHTRVLDGSRKEKLTWKDEEGYIVVDPNGTSYQVSLESLIRVDDWGVRGDVFDYLFRLSPREEVLNPKPQGKLLFLQNLRSLLPN